MKVRLDDVIYERGKNLIHFEVKENCLKQVSGVTYLGRDIYREKGFRARVGIEELEEKVGGRKDWRKQGKGGGGKWESTFADYSLRDQKEAKERAEAKLREPELSVSEGGGERRREQRVVGGDAGADEAGRGSVQRGIYSGGSDT